MKQWYAVQTKPRREVEAETNLQRQGFEVYLPRILLAKRRQGRWKEVLGPLFPRYLFVGVDHERTSIAPIRSTYGVSQMVRFGHHLEPIPNSIIEYLKQREDAKIGCYVCEPEKLSKGDPIEIKEGPFSGLKGVYEATSGEERVIVMLKFLGGLTRMTLPRVQVVSCH